jgi:hypothetical protein
VVFCSSANLISIGNIHQTPLVFTFTNAKGNIHAMNNPWERTMNRVHIKDFANQLGQTEAAILLGMTQGGLSKAIRVGRDVYVTRHADGTYTAEEVRPFPSQSLKKSAA